MIETIELRTEKYLDNRFDILSKRMISLEEHIKEGRAEITEIENQIKDLEESVDESYDVFQAKSSDEDFLEDEKKSLENRMEELFNRNTDDIVEVKEIEQELFAINDAKSELSSIKKKIIVNDLDKDELQVMDISQKDTSKDDNQSQKDNGISNKDKLESKKEIVEEELEEVLEEIEENYVLSKEDAKIVVERLKLSRNLVGKDNQRVIMTLSKIIDGFEKLI
ncbi:hypothetical protein SAMN02745111_00824 [Eubacterium uniforme]|uniref:Uncharacterized protein n=1 Tax=Eubacterium uniforme TaxID=39495 RepID=A0A1T4VEK4_9FIRM|nr:hypothetical protein [Eubacterium uniforme]SKA63404.1 hypothetical protein SAMN02745111_00824 [Eubacterium uniforme]